MSYIARHKWLTVFGTLVGVVAIVAFLFQWDWLIPLVDKQASAALGCPVTITHLHVQLGRTTRIEAEGITIANPDGWQGGGNFATIERLGLDVLPLEYIQHRQIVLPVIDVQSPKVDAQQLADGTANWNLGSKNPGPPSTGPGPKLGTLRIADGHAHVQDAKLNADFEVNLSTKEAPEGADPTTGQIVADAKGTYAKQPITAQFVGGALLSLRDDAHPYPVDLKLANGPTRIALKGTIKDPLAFAGANIELELSGPDMSLLLPLTGIAIPKTPAYRIAGKLDYATGIVKFQQFTGKVGSSDLAGNIEVDTKPEQRPVLTADLQSKLVDLKDLAGFIGGEPGDADKGTKRPAPSNGKVLPNDPISLPRLNVADVHLKYRATRIEGRRQPLDNMRADMDIVNGDVHLHPLSFGIGRGSISGDIALAEAGNQLHAKATIDFQRVDVDKLLSATGVARGAGAIGGKAVIDGTGRSVAEILGRGNGELKLYMGHGGNLSAFLVDLSGLEFGNAFLSALGVPNRAQLECLITDFVLQSGVATARTVMIDTDEARIGVTGDVNLRNETLNLGLQDRIEALQHRQHPHPHRHQRPTRQARHRPGDRPPRRPRRCRRRPRHHRHAPGRAPPHHPARNWRRRRLLRPAPHRSGPSARPRPGPRRPRPHPPLSQSPRQAFRIHRRQPLRLIDHSLRRRHRPAQIVDRHRPDRRPPNLQIPLPAHRMVQKHPHETMIQRDRPSCPGRHPRQHRPRQLQPSRHHRRPLIRISHANLHSPQPHLK